MSKKIMIYESINKGVSSNVIPVASAGKVIKAVPGSLYKIMVDGVQLTSKNSIIKNVKGHLLVEQDGELIVDLDYGKDVQASSSPDLVGDGWLSMDAYGTSATANSSSTGFLSRICG